MRWCAADHELTESHQFICALSANTDVSDVNKCMGAGMSDFFPKPVKIPVKIRARGRGEGEGGRRGRKRVDGPRDRE